MKPKYWLWLTGVLLLAGCGPKIVNHPKPELKVDFIPVIDTGCTLSEYGGTYLCPEGSKMYDLGCDRIDAAPDLMGGLKPAYPMAVCTYMPYYRPDSVDPYDISPDEYFFNVGGMMPAYVRYVIYTDGNYQVLKNPDQFNAVFGPVDSAEEALGYAIALTNTYAQYDLKPDRTFSYDVATLEDTSVETTVDGYLVHVFDYQLFGCGPHYYYAVDVIVTTDGQAKEIQRTPVYRDPAEDGLCVD